MNINNIYVGKSIFTRVAAIAIALLIGTSVMAQQPVQKQINQIKRNAATYLFNEATHESEAEALQLAHELLMHDVQEYIKESPTLRQASNAIIKDIQSKVLSLTMMRGDMHRVFVYVKKSDIEGVSNVTVINQASGATITISDTPEPVINVQQPAAPAAPVTPVLPATPAAPATPVVQAPPATPAAPATPPPPNTPTPAAPVNTPVQTTPTPAPAATPSTPNTPNIPGELAGWQRDAIASLLECSDVAAVKARLNRLKSEYRIKRYGNADKCPSPNESYWVIFNPDGTLHTILGTGADQRIDFRTNQTTTLQTYQGWSVLWFTLAK